MPLSAPPLRSRIDPRGAAFSANAAAMGEALAAVQAQLAEARQGGGPRYAQRHVARGRLLARDRVELLLDRDSPFLELCPLGGYDTDGGKPGAGLITGIGRVEGVECLITANDPTVQGGAINAAAVKKTSRASEIALQNRLPTLSLIESAKLNGHDPWAYLKDVFERLPTLKNRDLELLLPHNWQPANNAAAPVAPAAITPVPATVEHSAAE